MIRVGDTLYGYCNGYFGRDSYSNKRVEAVGSDWIIVRESTWTGDEEIWVPDMAYIEGGVDSPENVKMIAEWKDKKEEIE